MIIAIGCDHGGLVLKKDILSLLNDRGIEVLDFGVETTDSVDYPDYAYPVAKAVSENRCQLGIVLCGTGIGISIAANKVKGIRCAVIDNEFTAQMCKEHNNANIIAMGGRIITPETAVKLTKIWLDTAFAGGRHQNRIDKITKIENGEY